MDRRSFVAALSAVMLVAGCSTHYVPHNSGRVSLVMEGGSIAYQRDGEVFPPGFVGGGLVDAVRNDPEAAKAAEAFVGRNVAGFVSTILGSVCLVSGAVALSGDRPRDAQVAFGTGALICGLAGYLTGSILYQSALPFQLDAINIYNDNAQ